MTTASLYFKDFLHLIYPEACIVCERELTPSEAHVCSLCDAELIETSFHLFEEASEFDKLFWGRVSVSTTHALYFFQKKSIIQRVLFQLKYKHNASIGDIFGQRIGLRMKSVSKYNAIEVLLPVPLHPRKQFVRGYNQSLALANGISKTTELPVVDTILKRNANNSSQTKKGRFQRWDNVDSIFSVDERIKTFKHVAIIDDVITTGSTVEALIHSIREQAPEIEISVITLAIT